jgi:hypothetical protein
MAKPELTPNSAVMADASLKASHTIPNNSVQSANHGTAIAISVDNAESSRKYENGHKDGDTYVDYSENSHGWDDFGAKTLCPDDDIQGFFDNALIVVDSVFN